MDKVKKDSLVMVITAAEKLGFHSQFKVNGKNMISLKTDIRFHSNEVRIVHFYRFEGASNLEYTSIIYIIECDNGEKGTLVDGFDTTTETANFMLNVKNQE
ncbi:hypothetical protein IQ05_01269 [Flavobacterium tiangeerense]|uniref:Phosphoribosylpyrophosphate synthetase n=1 Tax=Flavobacterium tiangeerense TaxID=459471 RepID=A0ABY3FKU4_9FLAO|nr:hypothetical protein [Flavobacterium tiangeerense]TWI00612.1 hypothetical protein IQ05_01269 [Flavobacterium tiangeerense]